jgi:ABC-type phosphate/phosphonate transport system substrate-binding protein
MTRKSEIRKQKAEFVSLSRVCSIILLSAICLLHSVGCGDVSRGRYNQASLKMAVQPIYEGAAMNRTFMPLFGYLSTETGYEVQYLSSLTYDGLGATIEGSGATLVLCDPVTLLTLQRTHRAQVLAAGDGAELAAGLIIVGNRAGISDCAQLKRRTIAIVSQQSAQGYVSQAVYLQARGVVLPQDARLVNCGTMEQVIAAVRGGRADAGFVNQQALGAPRTTDVTVLCQTAAEPNWVCAALDGGSPESDAKVTAALLRLSPANAEQNKVLQQLGYSRFGELPAATMAELERQVRSLKIPY